MAEIIDVANAIFKFKNDWIYTNDKKKVSDEYKEKFFFIFNRYFSKKYPQKAQLLNLKTIDKATAMDLWFHFMKTQPYPDWFWSKSPKHEKAMPEKEYKQLLRHLQIKESDLDYLIDRYPDFIKEEQTYLKKLEKGN
jgi:hypothetical protein